MNEANHKIVVDPTFGHRRLDPMPSDAALGAFYESQYYHLIRAGGRAPELERLMSGGPDAEAERAWLEHTLYGDVAETLRERAPGTRVLDVGCGTGDLVASLNAAHFEAEGIEPSEDAATRGRERGLPIHTASLADFAQRDDARGSFDAVTLLNVLEHVPDPSGVLAAVHDLLSPNGVVCIRVPNDFSRIQRAAEHVLDKAPWWVAVPDHVNYFDHDSLLAFLDGHGFEPLQLEGDFPMEFFLLLGRDYVGEREVGAECHARRVELETKLSRDDRRALYRSLARGGLGRNSMVFARRRAPSEARVDMTQLDRRVGEYRIGPLRRADVEAVRVWRNAQLDVLRQSSPLSVADQERWFREVVQPMHRSPQPRFLLTNLRDASGELVGYGGLTNIDWEHGRAEVSFLVATERTADRELYARDFTAYLEFLKAWAFEDLGLQRLFTETYASRGHHIGVLEAAGFELEGRLVGHVRIAGRPTDSLMHGIVRS